MDSERQAFRQIALKLLEIRAWDDYNVFTPDDWIDEWLKETAHFAKKLYNAELDFMCPPKNEHRFTGRETPIFEPPKEEA